MIKDHYTMKELPSSEQPYEKALNYGVTSLSDADLLAVIIRTGTKEKNSRALAEDILRISDTYKGLLGLYHAEISELMELPGIGRVKAIELVCVAELAKRIARLERTPDRVFRAPSEIANFFMEELRSLETEHFYAIYFDSAQSMIRHELLFVGTVDSTIASPREVMRSAVRCGAAGLVIMHNHPGGDPTPSSEDMRTTACFMKACEIMGIRFLDHIVVGDRRYVSFVESGLMEKIENQNI